MIKEAISTLVEGQSLTPEQSEDALRSMLNGRTTPSQIGSFLTALRMKGETEEEIAAFATVMREMCTTIKAPPGSIDVCGTGGDGVGTFNISTAACFIIAAAGVPVAKHGNRAVSSMSGSANVLEALGIPQDLDPASVEKCISETGMGFMMAPVFHPSMRAVMNSRKEIGIRTVFNVLGPIVNPAGVRRQLVGVYDPGLSLKLARVLKKMGSERAMIVHGSGLDEITNTGNTDIVELIDGNIMEYTICPEDFGMETVSTADISGSDPINNARTMLSILRGKSSPRSDIVALNAGAGLYLAGRFSTIEEGVSETKRILESGRGFLMLERFADTCALIEKERQRSSIIADLMLRRIHPQIMVQRSGELCDYLMNRIIGTANEVHLESIDKELLSEPMALTYMMLQRILDMDMVPQISNMKSGVTLSNSILEFSGLSVIGECKPLSPGEMRIAPPPAPMEAVEAYHSAMVAGISVLGEKRFFGGGVELFSKIRRMTELPMLYKDFVFSKRQIEIAKTLGADSVLLIALALSESALDDLVHQSKKKGMETLVEMHSERDLKKVRSLANYDLIDMLGVNTRNLKTMMIDRSLLPRMRSLLGEKVAIAESGIQSTYDLEMAKGYDAVLIGSMFMSCEDLRMTATDIVKKAKGAYS